MRLTQGLYPRVLSTCSTLIIPPSLLFPAQMSRMPETLILSPEIHTGGERRFTFRPALYGDFSHSGPFLSGKYTGFTPRDTVRDMQKGPELHKGDIQAAIARGSAQQ